MKVTCTCSGIKLLLQSKFAFIVASRSSRQRRSSKAIETTKNHIESSLVRCTSCAGAVESFSDKEMLTPYFAPSPSLLPSPPTLPAMQTPLCRNIRSESMRKYNAVQIPCYAYVANTRTSLNDTNAARRSNDTATCICRLMKADLLTTPPTYYILRLTKQK